MPNNFNPDEKGQVAIPFRAHTTVIVDWSSDLDNDEIYQAAAEIACRRKPHWKLDEQAEIKPDETAIKLLIQDLEKLSDFGLDKCTDGYYWIYRCQTSERFFEHQWECVSHFILRQLQDIDDALGVAGEED